MELPKARDKSGTEIKMNKVLFDRERNVQKGFMVCRRTCEGSWTEQNLCKKQIQNYIKMTKPISVLLIICVVITAIAYLQLI